MRAFECKHSTYHTIFSMYLLLYSRRSRKDNVEQYYIPTSWTECIEVNGDETKTYF